MSTLGDVESLMGQLLRGLIGAGLGLPLAAAAGWIVYSRTSIPHRLPLPPALPGERRELESRVGRLSYYVDGSEAAPPLLLIHSINAAGSAYEVRPLYEHYRADRRVYALDLPGFGFSDRGPREYTPRLMTDAIHAMVDELRRIHGEAPIDALALSLASEFLARAATERPNDYRTIAIVSPTGFSAGTPDNGASGANRGKPALHGAFTFPLWNRPFFDALTSRPSIRYFLKKTWGSGAIDEGLAAYDYLTTHQPGAQNAPYYFVSGFLFSADIRRLYDRLLQPVFMAHGVRGDFQDYSRKRDVEHKENWTIRVFETGALPHFETLDGFVDSYSAFLQQPGG
jgi:pimeloyl-ACP methyl ester carboxylesterase